MHDAVRPKYVNASKVTQTLTPTSPPPGLHQASTRKYLKIDVLVPVQAVLVLGRPIKILKTVVLGRPRPRPLKASAPSEN